MSSSPSAGTFFLDTPFSVYQEMCRQLLARGWTRQRDSPARCDVVLGDRFHIPYSSLRCDPLPCDSALGGHAWVNYFRGSHKLTLKASMATLLKEVDETWRAWMPESYVLGGDQSKRRDEREALVAAAAEAGEDALWIVKPSSGAKGRHIQLVQGPEAVRALVAALGTESRQMLAVQRYVPRPLLLSHGRKFDVRVWVLLTSPFDILVFSQGSCRTASVPFDLQDPTNIHSHLTNHCLQLDAAHFGAYEEGNEMWFTQLQDYLTTSRGEPANLLETRVLPKIADIVVRTLLAMKPEIELLPDDPLRCFQLFGYDVIITEDLDVMLLEINGSPGVAEAYLSTVVARMLERIGVGAPPPAPGRRWSIEREEFVLLWTEGDAVPTGLH